MTKQEVYNILKTGSDGNAILYNHNELLVDIGVPYVMIKPYINQIKYVFITHKHSDHFNKVTVKRLAREKPMIKFIVGKYLESNLLELGLLKQQIVVVKANAKYRLLNGLEIRPLNLYHNVDNMGLDMRIGKLKLIHATDTYTLEHTKAINYDYYLLEENYCEIKVKTIQDEKERLGVFDYTKASVENHLSKQSLDKWLGKNNKNGLGVLVRLHPSKNNL